MEQGKSKPASFLYHRVGDQIECPWCGKITRLIEIHAHLGCPVCKRPVYDCCDGETAENNPHQHSNNAEDQGN